MLPNMATCAAVESSIQPFGRSGVRRRILTEFFNRPGLTVHGRELARRIGASAPAVSRELLALQQAGLLASRPIGRSREYRLAEGSTAQAARTFFQRTVGLEARLRSALADLPGIESALVHGSYTAGGERPDSDIDLIVIGTPDRIELAERLSAVEAEIGRPVNAITLTSEELQAKLGNPDHFWRSVFANPTLALIGPGLRVEGDGAR